jgi:DNA ligase (NAD+)
MDVQNTIQKWNEPTQLWLLCFGHLYISDFEFDLKLKELQELENKYPEYFDESSLRNV